MISVGIIGASGFTGAELLRLCALHPDLDVRLATGDTQAGTRVADLYPSLAAHHPDLVFAPWQPGAADGLDLVFLGLPHGASQRIVPELVGSVRWVVDLAADFRLTDAELYPTWYGEAHTAPELLGTLAYGLPELFRDDILAASAVAAPGCYPTATALALAPLVAGGLVETSGIVVDAASGVSGAGRAAKPNTAFCTVDEDFTAYGLLTHRHTPEMEQTVARLAPARAAGSGARAAGSGARAAGSGEGDTGTAGILFTPHLAPMNRGILATCYARPTAAGAGATTADLLAAHRDFYAGERFVVVTDGSPSTKATLGSNAAHVTVRHDERTGWVVAICAIDNLVKGASGQAVQCANLLAGLDEATGLPTVGVYP